MKHAALAFALCLTFNLSTHAQTKTTDSAAIQATVTNYIEAYYTGDAFHHPAQLTRPELHLPGCDDLRAAVATRQTIINRLRRESALLFPAHFAAPHFGHLTSDRGQVAFLPGLEP